MTKSQIDQYYIKEILPGVKAQFEHNGRKDVPARCFAYNLYVDGLHKDGLITDKQSNSYCIPTFLIKK